MTDHRTSTPARLSTPAEQRTPWRWAGVLAILAVVTISYVDRVNVSVLITDRGFTDHFGITGNRPAQGALMTLFLLGYGVAAIGVTPWFEARLGERRGLLASLAVWSAVTALCPLAGGAVLLLALRMLLGASEGPLFSLKTMYIRRQFAPTERGTPNAVSSMGVSLGTAVGLPLVAFAVHRFGWVASFPLVAALNMIIGLPLVALFVRTRRRARATGAARRPGSVQRLWAALRTPRLGWILVVEIATLGYLWGSTAWLPTYLLSARGFSLAQMGVLAALPFLLSLVSGFLGGRIIDRLDGARIPVVLVLGSVGTFCCATVVALADSRWVAAVALILANACWGVQGPAIPTLIQRHAPAEAVGSAYGVINGVGNLVSALLPTLMGAVIAGLGPHGFAAGFALLAATQLLTLAGALMLLRRP
jgi:predicted MFS family arabinose efflux permease